MLLRPRLVSIPHVSCQEVKKSEQPHRLETLQNDIDGSELG